MDGCNIYSNIASRVRARILNFPGFIAPVERYVRSWQEFGGGLYIKDTATATLIDTNVYENQAGNVSSDRVLNIPLTFIYRPLERYACSWLAGWRGTLHRWHGNADQHERAR